MQTDIDLIWTFMLDYTKGWGVRRHHHDYFQLYFCISGEGCFYLNGETYQIKQNDCLVIQPHQVHELYPIVSGQLRIIDTKFRIQDSKIYQAVMELPPMVSMEDQAFRELQQNMRAEWASGTEYSREMATLLFEQSLCLLLRKTASIAHEISFYHEIEQKIANLSGVEQKIAKYLSEHFLENITLDQLAAELRYSKNYLCKVFKSATGYTINECFNFLRIRKAYDLVCCTDHKLSEIALLCGFSSIHYFSRTFHRYVGKSPSEIRERDRTLLDKDIRLHGTFHYRYYTSMDEPDQK